MSSVMRAALLAILVLMAGAVSPAEPPSGSAAEAELSRFDEGPFRLSLPGGWRALHGSDEGFWSFRRADDRAQVSVALAFSAKRVPRSELDDVFFRFAQSRRRSLREQAPECETSKPTPTEHLEAISGSYRARCVSSARWKGDFLVVRSDLVASFLLETHQLDEREFVVLFDQLRAGAKLAQAR